jgi:hypothetical protein
MMRDRVVRLSDFSGLILTRSLRSHGRCKTATELARRLGYLVVSAKVKYDGSNEITTLRLR